MSLPYFRLYPTDYEADTSHLTLLEDGVYSRLLRLCWMTPGCSLPDDDGWIIRRLRARSDEEIEAVKLVLSEYFSRENQRVFNCRLMKEFQHSSNRHKSAVENGKKGGRPSNSLKERDKSESYGLADEKQTAKLKKANQNQNQNHNNTIGDFDEFWSQCPRKIGKDAALRAWKSALKRSDAKTIIDGMKRHAKEVQGREKQYIPHPSTWLNAGRWQDESQDAPTTSKQKATDHERMTNIATLIRKRISSAVTAVDAREAIAAGYVTKEECRGLGLV